MIHSKAIEKARKLIAAVKGSSFSIEELQERAVELAGVLLDEAQQQRTHAERRQQNLIARMMNDPKGKLFTTSMTDQCFRSHTPRRVADQLTYLIESCGVPDYLTPMRKGGLQLLKRWGSSFPKLFVPLMKRQLRKEMALVILPGEEEPLKAHIALRRREGVQVNLNHLGEAILGEEEASRRLQLYLSDLERADISYLSVKISTLSSQLNLLAWEETLAPLVERLELLYRAAEKNKYRSEEGGLREKFVNLDMEEYRDLHLTVDLFCRTLSAEEFRHHSAGIVLQSYLPDSFPLQQQLTEWAKKRVAASGAAIKIRIVKGANLAMERVEASLANWPQAPYLTKGEVDANYKRMLFYGCQPENAKAVHLGIASHNLFDIALGLLIRAQHNVESKVCFEMLEGMADQMRRVVQSIAGEMLLYCPAATREEFQNGVAYLIRRLDENTAPENFLRHLFELRSESREFERQASLFVAACRETEQVSTTPRRSQNRLNPPDQPDLFAPFDNEPDSDWSLPHNVRWAEGILATWSGRQGMELPLVIAGETLPGSEGRGIGQDPSFQGKELYDYALAGSEEVDRALRSAEEQQKVWGATSIAERSKLLALIARAMREKRGELIGAMVADTGKTVAEADVEVSEAIDFAEYYRRMVEELYSLEGILWKPKGTVLVAPPWNFPCSIAAGGILAALATGNCVIFKPATEALLVGWELVQLFWSAGVSKKVVQFLSCNDEPIGSQLVRDPRLSVVLLTGATATAKFFLKMRPEIDLVAETGGKNGIIVTSLADRDLAIKSVISSAFGHSGQKCSACSLLILEAELYDDPLFLNHLRDAAASLAVGAAWSLKSKITPLIAPPSAVLRRALTTLEPGESWLLKPQPVSSREPGAVADRESGGVFSPESGQGESQDQGQGQDQGQDQGQNQGSEQLWSPGIKLGVSAGSFTQQTEFFGPLLGVMRAENLEHAIALANGTPYGLTSGLHSLDLREQELWEQRIVAGNCYINRGITGAIVQRQPFGGCKESSFGQGLKAGGPNYLIQLMHVEEKRASLERGELSPLLLQMALFVKKIGFSTEELALWESSAANYAFYWHHYFSKGHDPSQLIGEENLLCYRPREGVTFRLNESDSLLDALRVAAAAATTGCPLEISGSREKLSPLTSGGFPEEALVSLAIEGEELFQQRVASQTQTIRRLRMLSPPGSELQKTIGEVACPLHRAPVVANGRIELLHYLREITLVNAYHRYGYLGARAEEKRKPPR